MRKQVNPIIEKIQKLLNLATSNDLHEAKLAAKMAQDLLIKHNLNLQDISDPGQKVYESQTIFTGVRRQIESIFINGIIREFYFVDIVIGRKLNRETRKWESHEYMMGEETNLQIAGYVRGFLNEKFKSLWFAYKKETGSLERHRKSFYMGLYKGFKSHLEEQRAAATTEKGLVLVKDQGLVKYVYQQHGIVKKSSSSVNINSADAVAKGYEQGRNIRVARAIESTTGNMGKALGGRNG